ncbi:MAG: hypothetical protein EBQ89_10240, partial [Alphaproteobacteria bacterium]|nr:hypothetical protein [Alphaproteobacteria bacterium]
MIFRRGMAHAPCRGRCGAAYVFLACLLLANPLWAETLSLTVRGGAHAAYDRLVFDLPQKIPYQVAQQGQEMRLTFQKSVRLNLAPLLAARLSRVGSYGVLEGDTTTFVMTMGAGARPKIFENKGAVVVDVAGARITQQAGVMRAPSASMAAAPEASPQEKTATEKTPPEKKTADQPAATPEKTNTVQPVPTQPHDAQSEQAQGVQQSSVTEMGAA